MPLEKQANSHHLVLGELTDFLTGSVLSDTLDERYLQKISKKLVLSCGFKTNDIQKSKRFVVAAGERKADIKIDFLVSHEKKIVLLIKYAPGSLVTRRLSTLALSRLIKPYQIPFAVITNGEDAEVIDGSSGKVVGTGLDNLPDKEKIEQDMSFFLFEPITKKIFDQASRIAYACEVDGACPCDSDVCIIK